MSTDDVAEAMIDDLPTAEEMRDDEEPVQVALDYVKGVLLGRIVDPVERWAAVTQFSERVPEALEHVRALCVGQLVHDDLSVEEAGRKLGINRQRANALLKGHDQPTPRQLKASAVEQEPGYRLGVFLGVVSLIGDALQKRRPYLGAQHQLDKLEQSAHQSPVAIVTRISESIARWTRGGAKDTRMAQLLSELDHATAALDDLPRSFLPLPQQGHMLVARAKTRLRLEP